MEWIRITWQISYNTILVSYKPYVRNHRMSVKDNAPTIATVTTYLTPVFTERTFLLQKECATHQAVQIAV